MSYMCRERRDVEEQDLVHVEKIVKDVSARAKYMDSYEMMVEIIAMSIFCAQEMNISTGEVLDILMDAHKNSLEEGSSIEAFINRMNSDEQLTVDAFFSEQPDVL